MFLLPRTKTLELCSRVFQTLSIRSNTLTFVDIPTQDEARKIWYNKQDRMQFKITQRKDRERVSHILASSSSESITQEDLCECIGMENLLSINVMIRTLEHKQNHVNTIVSEQRRQRSLNIHDEEYLGLVAANSSRLSRERSQRIATACFNMDHSR